MSFLMCIILDFCTKGADQRSCAVASGIEKSCRQRGHALSARFDPKLPSHSPRVLWIARVATCRKFASITAAKGRPTLNSPAAPPCAARQDGARGLWGPFGPKHGCVFQL